MKKLWRRQQKRRKLIQAKYLTRKEGVTLIEIIISLAIFGILMVLFTTLMGVAIQMRRNVFEQNRNSMKLIKELAEDDFTTPKKIKMEFEFNGEILTIWGDLEIKKEKDVTYHVFEPYEHEVKENE